MQVECHTFQLLCDNVTMYYVYLLKSEKNGRMYTGYTSDLKQRMTDHNSGKSSYTRSNRPYRLVYYEAFASKSDAQKRERNLKLRSNASAQLRKRISESINES
jgi:Predicted endonuclease containing a URI domain